MTSDSTAPAAVSTALWDGFSLEMTGRDVPALSEARAALPPGTRVNITFLGNEDPQTRLEAARAVRAHGLVPVPHLSARRLGSRDDFERFLAALHAEGASAEVFAVGGDPARPQGPYADSLSLITSGLLTRYGVRHVGICGYPEGHPAIADDVLWAALRDKSAALAAQGLDGSITTQFGFDAEPVLAWIEEVRRQGVDLPVRVGVPGPAGVRRLLTFAGRFGVAAGATVARKYGLSLTNLLATAGPDRFLRDLAAGHDPARHGEVKAHFYTFGGIGTTADWIARFRAGTDA